jgi:hypothetical protein
VKFKQKFGSWTIAMAIKKMQIKTALRLYLTPVRMAIIKNTTTNAGKGVCGGKGTLLHCWWECKLVQHYGKQYEGSTKY